MTSCCFREVVLQSVQALRAHQRVQCVPEVPGEREETLFKGLDWTDQCSKVQVVHQTVCELTGGPGGPGGPLEPIMPCGEA